jgi:hypothetical protein
MELAIYKALQRVPNLDTDYITQLVIEYSLPKLYVYTIKGKVICNSYDDTTFRDKQEEKRIDSIKIEDACACVVKKECSRIHSILADLQVKIQSDYPRELEKRFIYKANFYSTLLDNLQLKRDIHCASKTKRLVTMDDIDNKRIE